MLDIYKDYNEMHGQHNVKKSVTFICILYSLIKWANINIIHANFMTVSFP